MMVGTNVMVARVLLKKGARVPLHSHHNEQVTYILEGALHFFIDNQELTVSAGEVLCIPPHMPHEAMALEDTVDLDIFNPPRQDWIDKDDAYLRQDSGQSKTSRAKGATVDLGLKNRNVIVAASSDGIARAAAEKFAAEGAKVAMCSRDAKKLQCGRSSDSRTLQRPGARGAVRCDR